MLELRCYLFNLLGFLSCWSLVYLLSTYAKPQHNTPAPVEDLQPMSLPHLVNEMKIGSMKMDFPTKKEPETSWTLPSRVHFIWIGSVIPDKYVNNINNFCEHNPEYQVSPKILSYFLRSFPPGVTLGWQKCYTRNFQQRCFDGFGSTDWLHWNKRCLQADLQDYRKSRLAKIRGLSFKSIPQNNTLGCVQIWRNIHWRGHNKHTASWAPSEEKLCHLLLWMAYDLQQPVRVSAG